MALCMLGIAASGGNLHNWSLQFAPAPYPSSYDAFLKARTVCSSGTRLARLSWNTGH